MIFEEHLDQWQEFYLALAGASAVLVGLVYIALSLHLDKPGEHRPRLLGLGGQAILNHGNALLLSLVMLMPFRPPWLPGVAVSAVALNGLINSLNFIRRRGHFQAPLAVPIGLSLVLLTGSVLVMAREQAGLYLLPAGGIGLVLSAMQYIWWMAVLRSESGVSPE